MKKTEIIKGRGFKRKTSLGLVCGISLVGAMFLGANGVSADEVTSPTTTTPTTATTNESKTVVVDEGLTEVANKAKEAGLTVSAEPTKNIGTANTEEEGAKLAEQAKKEVADQKAQIEKTVADYKASSEASEAEKAKLKDQVTKNPLVYYGASSQLADAGDVDFNNNKVTFGEFKSTKGDVKFVNAPNSNVDFDNIKNIKELVNAGTGSQKEINTFYGQGNMFGNPTSVSDKKNLKAVPIAISEGESITYKLNYSEDSELGKLGVATVEKQVTLVKSPVNNGKVVLLADRYGSVNGNFIIGGEGQWSEVVKAGDWTYRITKKYLDKNGNVVDAKELTAKVYNKYTFGGKEVVKASDFTLQSTPINRGEVNNNVTGALSQKKSTVATYGGDSAYFVQETTGTIIRDNDPLAINPYSQVVRISSQKLPQLDTSKLSSAPTAPTVNYHLVSYTVNKPKATNNADKLKKGSIVQKFVDESGKEIAKSTTTGEKPVDETVKLMHPNEITFEGKTYTFTKQDKADPTKIPNGTETITYVYKLKETPKPVPTPTPTPKPTPAPVEKPTTIHIDGETGKEIAPKEDGTKPFKSIDGYEPAPKDPKNVENPKGETVRVYNVIKKGNVEVRYVKDDASKTVLKEPVADTVGAKVGSDYDTTDHKPTTITKDGVTYELVRTEGVEKGKVVEGKTVVTYVYREVQKPITIHIDTEGNPVAPQEDGTKPFKEIEGYKPAPKDSKNVEDPKGVTVRVYEKVKPEAPQEAPKTPEQPQKPQGQQPATQTVATKQLPNTGSEASTALAIAGLGVLGLGALAYKKKEN